MIAYYFPPIKSIGTLRNYNVYNEFKHYFSAVNVLTTSNRHRLPQEPLAIDEKDITEAPAWDYRRLMNSRQKKDAHFTENAKKSRLVQTLIKLTDSFPFNILVGDGGLIYILIGVYRALRLIRENKITHIYSSFRPYSDHMVAYLVKRLKPELFWIADYRDVHVDPIIDNLYFKSFQHWCNRQIINRADSVTTVSEGLAKNLRQYSDKVYVMRNGIGKIAEQKVEKESYPKFTIAYTGSMFLDKRNPVALLKSIQQLIDKQLIDRQKIQIIYAGKDVAIWQDWIKQYKMEDLFVAKGLVSLKEATQLQHNCHINLLLTYSSPEMSGNLTGKFYEYLAAGNPVLTLVNGPIDQELEHITEELNAGLVAYHQEENPKNLQNFIQKHYQEWLSTGTVSKNIDQQKLKDQYTWPAMMKAFMQYLRKKEISNL